MFVQAAKSFWASDKKVSKEMLCKSMHAHTNTISAK